LLALNNNNNNNYNLIKFFYLFFTRTTKQNKTKKAGTSLKMISIILNFLKLNKLEIKSKDDYNFENEILSF
jgi:hypothetical protein